MNKRKIAIATISILAVILCIFYLYFYNINRDKILKDISSQINPILNNDISFEKLELNIFPIPSIKMKRIKITEGIFADDAQIEPSLLKLLLGKFSPKKIVIKNLYINPKKTTIIGTSFNKIISEFAEKDLDISKFRIEKLWDTAVSNRMVLSDLEIAKYSKNVDLHFSLSNDIKVDDNTKYSISDKSYSSITKIYNKNFQADISRKFNKNTSLSGSFDVKISSLGSFVQDISPYFDFILNDYIKSTESMTISGLITHDDEYSIYPQIKIESPNFVAEASYWSPVKVDENDIFELKISKLDFGSLSKGPEKKVEKDDAILNLDSTKLKMQISGSGIKILNDELNNFDLYAVGNGQTLDIVYCKSKIGTDGEFDLSGKIEDNIYRPRFKGSVSLSHPNVNKLLSGTKLEGLTIDGVAPIYLSSQILVSPIDLMMNDFNLKISGQNIKGSVTLKQIVNENLLLGNINLDDLNLDDSKLPIFRNIYNYFKSLGYNMNDQSYDSKFIPLRSYPLKTSIDITGENLNADGNKIDRFSMFTSFGGGRLKIDNYLINIGKNTIKGEAVLVATSLKPQLKFFVTDGIILSDNISGDSLDNFINYLNNNINISEIDFESEGYISTLELGNLKTQNLNWKLDNKNNYLNLSDLTIEGFYGNGKISGNILLNPIKLNMAFGLNGIDSTKLMKILPQDLPIKNGLISVNGQASAVGNTSSDIKNSLYIQGEFLGKDFTFDNVGIDDLIQKLSTPQLNQEMADKLFKTYISEGVTSVESTKGSYELNNQLLTIKDITINSKYFTGSAGIALSTFDQTIDLNAVFSFYPIGAKIFSPSSVSPIKLSLISKGGIFKADKLINFLDATDIYRLPKLYNSPSYNSERGYNR